jgi:ADP-ribose pyrophosphatase YjhB (NUDIX family)
VGAVITDGGRVLLARRGVTPWRGRWEFPGGFCEVGETVEQALRREIEEELHVLICRATYLGGWPDVYSSPGGLRKSTLNMYFLVDCGSPAALKTTEEAVALRWLSPGDRPPPLAFRHTGAVLAAARSAIQCHQVRPVPEHGRRRGNGRPQGPNRGMRQAPPDP